MPTFNQLVREGTSDICKEVYSTGASERIQLFKKEKYRRIFPTEERCMYSC